MVSNVCERFLFLTAPAFQRPLSRSLARSIRSRWAALLDPFQIASPSPWICSSNSITSLDRYPLKHFVLSFHLLLGWGEESVVETRSEDSSPWIGLSCGASCSGNILASYPSEALPMRFFFMTFNGFVSGTLHWDSRSVRSVEHPWYEHQPDRKWIPVAKLCQSQLPGLRLLFNWYLICEWSCHLLFLSPGSIKFLFNTNCMFLLV